MAILDSVSGSEITGLSSSILELALDSLIENEFVKSIPILGSIVQTGKATLAIRDRLFMRKVCRFLFELQDIPQTKRKKFVSSLEDKGERRRAGETLLSILEQSDRVEKAALIGKFYRAAINEEIKVEEVTHLSFIINQTFLEDLNKLKSWFEYFAAPEIKRRWGGNNDLLDKDEELILIYQRLAAVGLLTARYPKKTTYDRENPQRFSVSGIGIKLLEFGLLDNVKKCIACTGGRVYRGGEITTCSNCGGTGKINIKK